MIDTATLQAGTCTRSRLITYPLDSSSWIRGAMDVEKGIVPQFSVIIETATLHAGTCTRSKLVTYTLDSSILIHEAIHVEERVEYHSPQ